MEPLPEPTYRLYNCCRCGVLVDICTRYDRGNIYADLLFEVITRRYQLHPPVISTTNKLFGEWNHVFPSSSSTNSSNPSIATKTCGSTPPPTPCSMLM